MHCPVTTLLLDCLHQNADRLPRERLSALSDEGWQALLDLARQHHVSGLLYRRLKLGGMETLLPGAASATLKTLYQHNAVSNLRIQTELRTICAAFREQEVPLILLKGAYLAPVVYSNLGLREMGDIDLLVPAGDLQRAAGTLEGLGYRPMKPYMIPIQLPTAQHLPAFVKPQATPVELHWTICEPGLSYSVDPGDLWARAVPVRIADVEVQGLAPEDLLLHLCFHSSFHHLFELGLRPFCDIGATIIHYGETVQWSSMLERARCWHWDRGVYLALRLAKELVGAAVPGEVLRSLRPHQFDESVVAIAVTQVFSDGRLAMEVHPNMARLWHRKDLAGKVSEFGRRLFVPKSHLAAQYVVPPESPFLWLYYPVRLADLLIRHWRPALKLHRSDPVLAPLADRKLALRKWLAGEG